MPGLIEILIIVLLSTVLFSYKRIPFLGKSLGRGLSEFGKSFDKASNVTDFIADIEEEESNKQSDARLKQ